MATRKRGGIASAVAIIFVYLASVIGYFWLDSSATELDPGDLQHSGETVVLVELTAIRPVEDALAATVLVLPDRSLLDESGALKNDLVVRLYPANDFDQLCYPSGHVPGREQTTIHLYGDADRWPFDNFRTGTLSADAFIGKCDSDNYTPTRVEVAGSLNGWNIHSERLERAATPHSDDNVTVSFSRARGPLALIAGFCLVLIALPAIALYVAIELVLGRKVFQPAFGTFFASMLFAVVPIRNLMPGSPPAGSWVDEAITVWVLIALTAATVIYVAAWARRAD
jgi:hypothetical protein